MSDTESSNNINITDDEKLILTGRIYPAIQSCVGNRYKIILGYFIAIGFLLSMEKPKCPEILHKGTACYLAIVFSLFVVHNSINYYRNKKDQMKLEHYKPKNWVEKNYPGFSVVDVLSGLIMVAIILGGYFFLKNI